MVEMSSSCLSTYFVVPDTDMPSEDIMSTPVHADTLEECARICDRHNATLGDAPYSWQRCNGFVYDAQTRRCALKNKAMGNFQPQQGPTLPACAFYDPRGPGCPRYYSGYKKRDLVTEINDPLRAVYAPSNPLYGGAAPHNVFPDAPAWSTDNYAAAGQSVANCQQTRPPSCYGGPPRKGCDGGAISNCTGARPCTENFVSSHKPLQYDTRPGAIFSEANHSSLGTSGGTAPFYVDSMQQCADACAAGATPFGPHSGANAWTYWPDYRDIDGGGAGGTCVIGHVREPFYSELTSRDRGAVSGFALTSLSRERHRFLFG